MRWVVWWIQRQEWLRLSCEVDECKPLPANSCSVRLLVAAAEPNSMENSPIAKGRLLDLSRRGQKDGVQDGHNELRRGGGRVSALGASRPAADRDTLSGRPGA